MVEISNTRELLASEWEASWTQSRHLETLRSQYIGFFLTVIVGSLAFGAAHFHDIQSDPGTATAASIAVLGPAVVTWFVAVSVRRFGDVLAHYGAAINYMRRELWRGAVPCRMDIEHEKSLVRRPGPRIQGSAELLLLSAQIAILASDCFLLSVVARHHPGTVHVVAAVLSVVVVLAMTVATARRAKER